MNTANLSGVVIDNRQKGLAFFPSPLGKSRHVYSGRVKDWTGKSRGPKMDTGAEVRVSGVLCLSLEK